MAKQAVLYIAVAAADMAIADVILAQLKHKGYKCIDCMDVPDLLDRATDMYGTMSECDVIVLIDSLDFRQQSPNYELQFAQELNKPLIVISLHQKVDESKSTWRVRLFDFMNPRLRDWQHVIKQIIEVTEDATQEPDFGFLF